MSLRNSAIDPARLSQEVADLRDRVSRLEGMLPRAWRFLERRTRAAIDAGGRELPIRRAEFSLVSTRRVRNAGAAANAPEVCTGGTTDDAPKIATITGYHLD
jgi:hypothetical protein